MSRTSILKIFIGFTLINIHLPNIIAAQTYLDDQFYITIRSGMEFSLSVRADRKPTLTRFNYGIPPLDSLVTKYGVLRLEKLHSGRQRLDKPIYLRVQLGSPQTDIEKVAADFLALSAVENVQLIQQAALLGQTHPNDP